MDKGLPDPPKKIFFNSWPYKPWSLFFCGCPFFGTFLCLGVSYILHHDEIVGRNSTWCTGLTTEMASISITIGVYIPERFIWALLIIFHLPGRLFSGSFYADYYLTSTSPAAQTWWYKQLACQMKWEQLIETYALVILSIVDIKSCFPVHAGVFTVWLVFQSFYQFNNAFLHYFSGVYRYSTKTKVLFWIKVFLFISVGVLAITSGVSYLHFMNECEEWAYLLFIVTEYTLVIMNITFHLLGIFEFNGARWGFYGDYSGMKEPLVPIPVAGMKTEPAQKKDQLDKLVPKSYSIFLRR